MPNTRYYMLGERTLVVESSPPISRVTQEKIWGLAEALTQDPLVLEVVPGMNNLTIILKHIPASQELAIEQLKHWWQQAEQQHPESRLVEIPVFYGKHFGPDLESLASQVELSVKQVIELHSSATYTVYFIGFQPGFPYLAGLDPALSCPRHAQPRQKVPAGSVGIAGSQTGIYPLASPGGWQLIGQTKTKLFDLQRATPILLRPGDQLRFVPQKEGVC